MTAAVAIPEVATEKPHLRRQRTHGFWGGRRPGSGRKKLPPEQRRDRGRYPLGYEPVIETYTAEIRVRAAVRELVSFMRRVQGLRAPEHYGEIIERSALDFYEDVIDNDRLPFYEFARLVESGQAIELEKFVRVIDAGTGAL